MIFRHVSPCGLVEKYNHGTRMEKLDLPETLIAIYQTARLHTPEYRRKALTIHNMWKNVKLLLLFLWCLLVVKTWNNQLYADNVNLGWQ
jgi:hypothetical protein